MNILRALIFAFLLVTLSLSAQANTDSVNKSLNEESQVEIVLASEVNWEKLNPARGDKSPQAGTLWGDRKAAVPTGFLAKFVDGFSSPPHIHNATYRAVVISGSIHNDDPAAAKMWMPEGSFWTQPKGENHITAAKGDTNIALVEIDNGPYLVLPAEKSFDSGERPINVDASNIVWGNVAGKFASDQEPKIAYLWGDLRDGSSNGTFVQLPAGFKGNILSHGSTFRSVVIKGQLKYFGKDIKTMDAGSYFGSKGVVQHQISVETSEASVIYIRTNGRYEIGAN